jgi:hypothetical protein
LTATSQIPGLAVVACGTGGGLVCREVREDDRVWVDPGWDRRPAVAGGFTVRVEQFLGLGGVVPSGERTVWVRGPVLRGHPLAGQILIVRIPLHYPTHKSL